MQRHAINRVTLTPFLMRLALSSCYTAPHRSTLKATAAWTTAAPSTRPRGRVRAEQLARPYCSLALLAARAAPFELLPVVRQPKGYRDLLLRPLPRRLHWVPRWLNVLLMESRSASCGSPCGGASSCGTCLCRWWLAAQAGEEDESSGGGSEAINEEEEQEEAGEEEAGDEEAAASGGPAGRDRKAECARHAAARTAQLADAQARRDAHVAAVRAVTEVRSLALPEQLQGMAAAVDLAPAARP